jgi:hypothetical protein
VNELEADGIDLRGKALYLWFGILCVLAALAAFSEQKQGSPVHRTSQTSTLQER